MRWCAVILTLVSLPSLATAATAGDIHQAVRAGDLARVKVLLEQDPAQVRARDPGGYEPLHYGVFAGRADIVEFLLAKGADPNAPEPSGWGPLTRAVLVGQPSVLELLLKGGADPNRFSPDDGLPLFTAVSLGYGRVSREMTELLVKLGADVRRASPLGETALHRAAEGGDAGVVAFLIRAGTPVDARYRGDLTALHVAAAHGHADAAGALLAAGADPNARSRWCGTPLHQAEAARYPALAALLRANGATDQPRGFPRLTGPLFGEVPPAAGPKVFAPGVLANVFRWVGPPSFSADGREVFWSAGEPHDFRHRIWTMREVKGAWTAPQVVAFAASYSDANPVLSRDGAYLFFKSNRPLNGQATASLVPHLWVAARRGDEWAEPVPIRETLVPDKAQGFPTIDRAGRLIYQGIEHADSLGGGDLYICTWRRGRCDAPRTLGPPVNDSAFEAAPTLNPDGTRLIFMSTRALDSSGPQIRFFASARRSGGTWSAPHALDLGLVQARQPIFGPDGGTLFYVRGLDLMWARATPGLFRD